jgi:hypothetical protein
MRLAPPPVWSGMRKNERHFSASRSKLLISITVHDFGLTQSKIIVIYGKCKERRA